MASPTNVAMILQRTAQEVCKRLRRNQVQEVVVESPQVQPGSGRPEAEEVARLAHQYWLERGSPIGTPEEDWFRAEQEFRLRSRQLEQGRNHGM